MSKRNRKRTKRYSGEDAKHLQPMTETQPSVRRYSAVDRGRIGQWWYEKKRVIRIGGIVALIALVIVWLLTELFRIIF